MGGEEFQFGIRGPREQVYNYVIERSSWDGGSDNVTIFCVTLSHHTGAVKIGKRLRGVEVCGEEGW